MTSTAHQVATPPLTAPLIHVHPDAENARRTYDETTLQALAASIKAIGLIQPIVVRRGTEQAPYIVIAGHRRLKAAKLAGLKDVPIVVRELSAQESHLAQFAENREREGLTPLEEAQHLARHLLVTKQTQEQLAQALGVVPSVVSDAVTLANLPAPAQALFTGKAPLSAAHARELARLKAYPDALTSRVKEIQHNLKYGETLTSKQLRQQVDWDLQDLAARDKVEKAKVVEAKQAAKEAERLKTDKKAQLKAAAQQEMARRQAEAEKRARARDKELTKAILAILDERTPRYVEFVLDIRQGIKLPDGMLFRLAESLEFDRGGPTVFAEELEQRVLPKLPGILKSGQLKDHDPKGALSFVACVCWIEGLQKEFTQELQALGKKRLEATAAKAPSPPARKGARK